MALQLSTGLRTAWLGTTALTKSFKDMMKDGVIRIYSGSQPVDADAAETGTLLVLITLNSGSFTPGSPDNGLEFGDASDGVIAKADGEVWSGVGLAEATAGWFRFYDNNMTTGASTSAIRFDGSVGTSGAQLILSNINITVGATITIDSFQITLPASA